MKYQIQQKGISLVVEKLPNCLADSEQLNHVFSNLLDNAIKYVDENREPSISISGKIENGMSIYSVKDNGIGITPDQQEKIFEIYHRLDPTEQVQGEGLGLTIVNLILERLNGKVWLESEHGQGTTVYIALPCVREQPQLAESGRCMEKQSDS